METKAKDIELVECPACRGTGTNQDGLSPGWGKDCPECAGRGFVPALKERE